MQQDNIRKITVPPTPTPPKKERQSETKNKI